MTNNGDIYVGHDYLDNRVDKWLFNATNSTTVLFVTTSCSGLFMDIKNNLYCSQSLDNFVVKHHSYDDSDTSIIVAGSDLSGSASDQLFYPIGIFVDLGFNLYVADAGNNRIQFFPFGEFDAITVAGSDVTESFPLNYPTSIILDADNYLFITDSNNNRVIRSTADGFQCVVGCSEVGGSQSDQLQFPSTLAFDTHGNLFVIDFYNARIQKFIFATNSCGKY